jgi:pyruvate,water dikinase
MEGKMTAQWILPLSDPGATLETVGGKGDSLARLARAGLPVPDGFHVTTRAYRLFVSGNDLQTVIMDVLEEVDPSTPASLEKAEQAIRGVFSESIMPDEIAHAIAEAYEDLPGRQPAVAVRSSGTAEDLPGLSFAGQQDTYLNIRGAQAVLKAVQRCWASLWTARAISYRVQHGIDQSTVSLGVVVQQLIPAEAAGILFTANPLTGQRDQAMISAAWGLGEAIVGGQVTPDTLLLEKSTGRVLNRQTAEKQVMTVRIDSGTEERPVPEALRSRPVLSDGVASELVRLGARIEALYGMPVDIEWALADHQYSIVQARPITALPEPEPAPPAQWKLPKGQYAAIRNNIVELMADPLTPLFDTLGRGAINASLQRLMTLFFGRPGIMPAEIILSVNGYAYNNGSLKPAALVKVLLGSVGTLKRMFTGAVERWTETGRPRYVAIVDGWQTRRWHALTAEELLSAVRELSEAAFDAYGALVSGVIPAAWISEALFTFTYNLLIKRGDDPAAPAYLMGFDSLPIRAEKSLYDLAEWIRPRAELAATLRNTPTAQLAADLKNGQIPPGCYLQDWHEWQGRFQAHLDRFGHTIYNLDFANPVPADDPIPLLETCRLFINQQGANPYARQEAASQRRELATQTMHQRLKGLRLRLFNRFLQPAQRFAPLREDGLADVGLSYPLLRQMLLELGDRFTKGGMIESPEDIFWLNQDEVETAAARLDCGDRLSCLSAAIPVRKAAWRAAKHATPPARLPQTKLAGINRRKASRRGGAGHKGDTLKGVPASPGRVTAPACVLEGPQDFSQMKAGDVLVAAITTPAWTPLFARAAAVVTDIGGPLSHGSIVAREYGIPAVLGTEIATKRIRSGQMITVDGGAGVVILGNNGI